jgi:hypothetical protein
VSRYYLTDGKEVPGLREARKIGARPSVTTVINSVAPHGYKFLDDKRLKEVLKDESMDYEAKIELLGNKPVFEMGLLLHQAAETYWETGVKSDPLHCPSSTKVFFNILKKIEPVEVEGFHYSPSLNTGGRIDLVGKEGKKLNIYDYKTVSTFKGKPETTWLAQLGAYYGLLLENDIQVQGGKIIQFSKKNEGCSVLTLTVADLLKGLFIFQQARTLHASWIGI